ncbi:hypothetical protein HPB50_026525 [Hyalomma asiaticum]|uniref:Uncharacterized protein n=1 Tax=Hyalomma asiaticum TaxID=266040 RepID=A0ACB7SC74_HYAAI|nr:hypothetical protein HPB50_026525 [Hyalomma asiaticum]
MRTTNSNRAPKRITDYRGYRPSALLFQARTGSLATQQRRHELFDSDPSCRLCGAPEETVAHILLACPRLHDQPRTSSSLAELLGLASQAEEACLDQINSTKNLLLGWERLCRQTESSSAGKTPPALPSTATCTGTHIDTSGKGDTVWVRDIKETACVLSPASKPRSYVVETPTAVLVRNRVHLVPYSDPTTSQRNEPASRENSEGHEDQATVTDATATATPQVSNECGVRVTRFGRRAETPKRLDL